MCARTAVSCLVRTPQHHACLSVRYPHTCPPPPWLQAIPPGQPHGRVAAHAEPPGGGRHCPAPAAVGHAAARPGPVPLALPHVPGAVLHRRAACRHGGPAQDCAAKGGHAQGGCGSLLLVRVCVARCTSLASLALAFTETSALVLCVPFPPAAQLCGLEARAGDGQAAHVPAVWRAGQHAHQRAAPAATQGAGRPSHGRGMASDGASLADPSTKRCVPARRSQVVAAVDTPGVNTVVNVLSR